MTDTQKTYAGRVAAAAEFKGMKKMARFLVWFRHGGETGISEVLADDQDAAMSQVAGAYRAEEKSLADQVADVSGDRAEYMAIRAGQAMREMLARFVETDSPVIAESIRANWMMGWGKDPGKLDGPIPHFIWDL